eukprot:TRINITY_DN2154_c0_g3_i1.p2 TRINITY_DN2154_c0_g3~~TRINITY_DN2154_c0_g3_i1.p2  ORF type:complete len:200 (-),score=46.17 TRINITY_DN2154_c0_g3_i1:56-655(-)
MRWTAVRGACRAVAAAPPRRAPLAAPARRCIAGAAVPDASPLGAWARPAQNARGAAGAPAFAGAARSHMSEAAAAALANGAEKIEFDFQLRDGSRKTVSVPSGVTVLEAAHMNGIDLEGACEASLACSTCHVILATETFEAVGEACETEEDLLDLAPCLTPTSRLGCQITVDARLRGAVVTLPPMTLNFYVDGHVPQPH